MAERAFAKRREDEACRWKREPPLRCLSFGGLGM